MNCTTAQQGRDVCFHAWVVVSYLCNHWNQTSQCALQGVPHRTLQCLSPTVHKKIFCKCIKLDWLSNVSSELARQKDTHTEEPETGEESKSSTQKSQIQLDLFLLSAPYNHIDAYLQAITLCKSKAELRRAGPTGVQPSAQKHFSAHWSFCSTWLLLSSDWSICSYKTELVAQEFLL